MTENYATIIVKYYILVNIAATGIFITMDFARYH